MGKPETDEVGDTPVEDDDVRARALCGAVGTGRVTPVRSGTGTPMETNGADGAPDGEADGVHRAQRSAPPAPASKPAKTSIALRR